MAKESGDDGFIKSFPLQDYGTDEIPIPVDAAYYRIRNRKVLFRRGNGANGYKPIDAYAGGTLVVTSQSSLGTVTRGVDFRKRL